jgi:predicted MPP superfamily phosphohydrolase
VRIVHLSDIHIWKYNFQLCRLASKRAVGMASLLAGRSRRFRLDRLGEVVARVRAVRPDHLLITGDLTTTSLPEEFLEARRALADLLGDPQNATVLPGNHDRYTTGSVRSRRFEQVFGAFAPETRFPWLRRLDPTTAILGLDASRSHWSARGRLPAAQLERARELLERADPRPDRLIIACHYPVEAPPAYEADLRPKRLVHSERFKRWLAGVGPHLYCCGHVHAAWAFVPPTLPNQLCLNAGAPLLRDPTGRRPPGFLEITLIDGMVEVVHHAWSGSEWSTRPLIATPWYARQSLPIPRETPLC